MPTPYLSRGDARVRFHACSTLCRRLFARAKAMGEAQRRKRDRGSDRIPEFWIRPQDRRGSPLDARLLEASRKLWPWAYRHVEIELHDGARAAELLEQVAMDVSARLRTEPEAEPHLTGHLV